MIKQDNVLDYGQEMPYCITEHADTSGKRQFHFEYQQQDYYETDKREVIREV